MVTTVNNMSDLRQLQLQLDYPDVPPEILCAPDPLAGVPVIPPLPSVFADDPVPIPIPPPAPYDLSSLPQCMLPALCDLPPLPQNFNYFTDSDGEYIRDGGQMAGVIHKL